jgi:hypothetical protein
VNPGTQIVGGVLVLQMAASSQQDFAALSSGVLVMNRSDKVSIAVVLLSVASVPLYFIVFPWAMDYFGVDLGASTQVVTWGGLLLVVALMISSFRIGKAWIARKYARLTRSGRTRE